MENFKLKNKLMSLTFFGLIGFLLSILVAVAFNHSDGVDNEKLIILSPCIGFIISAFFEMWLSYRYTKELQKEGKTGYTGPSVGTELLKSLVGSVLAALAIAGLVL